MSIGKSCGKLIISGEHAVVYNNPAIAFPIFEIETIVEIVKNNKFTIESKYGITDNERLLSEHEGINKIVKEFTTDFQLEDKIKIIIKSVIPTKGGLGSSAAVSKAVIEALIGYYQIPLTMKQLFYYIQVGEKVHHLNPSGIDGQTVLLEQPIVFTKKRGAKKLKVNFDGFLIIADTGKESLTIEAVSIVKEYKKNNELRFKKLLKLFKKITIQTKKALKNNAFNELKMAIINNQLLLEEIGVSDVHLDKLIRAANNGGASAAKLTGGGIGGAMFALTKNRDIAENVKNELIKNGAVSTYIINLGDYKHESNS